MDIISRDKINLRKQPKFTQHKLQIWPYSERSSHLRRMLAQKLGWHPTRKCKFPHQRQYFSSTSKTAHFKATFKMSEYLGFNIVLNILYQTPLFMYLIQLIPVLLDRQLNIISQGWQNIIIQRQLFSRVVKSTIYHSAVLIIAQFSYS